MRQAVETRYTEADVSRPQIRPLILQSPGGDSVDNLHHII